MNYKNLVDQFWNKFNDQIIDYELAIRSGKTDYVIKELLSNLTNFKSVASIDVNIANDNMCEIFFLNDNSQLNIFLNYYLANYHENEIYKNWNFHYTFLPVNIEDKFYSYGDIVINSNELEVKITVVDDGEILLLCYCKKFENISSHDEGNKKLCIKLVNLCLGQVLANSIVNDVKVVYEVDDTFININRLHDEIISLQEDGFVENAITPFEKYHIYNIDEEVSQIYSRGETSGIVMFLEPYIALMNNDIEFFNSYKKQGVEFIYVMFEKLSKDRIVDIINQLEDLLATNQCGKVIGNPDTEEVSCLDLICFNNHEVIDSIEYVFENEGIYNLIINKFVKLNKNKSF